jgi:hypothetical protein
VSDEQKPKALSVPLSSLGDVTPYLDRMHTQESIRKAISAIPDPRVVKMRDYVAKILEIDSLSGIDDRQLSPVMKNARNRMYGSGAPQKTHSSQDYNPYIPNDPKVNTIADKGKVFDFTKSLPDLCQTLTLPTSPIPSTALYVTASSRPVRVVSPPSTPIHDEEQDRAFYTAWVLATTESPESANILLSPGDTYVIKPGQPEVTLTPVRVPVRDL